MSDHCTMKPRVPMEPKVTIMVLKVDLQCSCCYKKVKRLLCKYPQIRDQVFDEKNNTVTIKVVCCSPEKIRDKLCCKGGKSIKSIEIKEPPKPPPPQKPKPPPEGEKQKPPPPPPPSEKTKPPPPPSDKEKSKPPPPSKPSQGIPMPVQGYPPVYPVPVCCGPCSRGQSGGPCYEGGYGRVQPRQRGFDPCTCGCGGGSYRASSQQRGYDPCTCGCGGVAYRANSQQRVYDPCTCGCGGGTYRNTSQQRGYDACDCGCGGGAYCRSSYNTCRCDYYPCRCEENPAACAVM